MKNTRMNSRKRARKNFGMIFLAVALTMVIGMSFGTAYTIKAIAESAQTPYVATEPAQDTSPAIYVAQRNANSVVGVLTNTETWNRSNRQVENQAISQGSGVVIAEGGYILTNNHVVDDGTAFQILMPDGEKVDAELVGTDSSLDLAVLQVNEEAAAQLVPVTIGNVEDLLVGSTVVAIGNPGGEVLANTVTQGIVSALERTSVSARNTTRRISYIQHDAAINSGNSGGGLFNFRGELVGINTLKYSGSSYSGVSFEGLGFAIPVDAAVEVAADLIEYGKVQRPGLGITASNYEGPDEPMNDYAPNSVLVASVNEGGAAEAAGILQYDFIYEVDGERISSMQDLTAVLDSHEIGDTVHVKLVRYNQAGYYRTNNYGSLFNYGYGFGYGYGGNNNNNLVFEVGGGYEFVECDVTLQVID